MLMLRIINIRSQRKKEDQIRRKIVKKIIKEKQLKKMKTYHK
jgi:hypothetical protein